ncbi:MAG: hypothetical protein HYY51_01190 [Candidatus Magasanikbacteria bacterium]|nr:hypothetical protein [Candidatus Magasanikbacteria bacterium]
MPDTTACNDGLACTLNDECTAGTCAGSPKVCDDSKPCTTDSCDAATGACVFAGKPDGTACAQGSSVCVATTCYPQDETCATDGEKKCRQTSGVLGHYECMVAQGGTLGVWTLQDSCGPVESSLCGDDFGCMEPGGAPCTPSCTGKSCGDSNGCGGTCGSTCGAGKVCKVADFSCVDCLTAAQCDDANASTTDACTAANVCTHTCVPQCTGKQCGADGCGGTCGTCAAGKSCSAEQTCVDAPPAQCTTDANCKQLEFCGGGLCYPFLDEGGETFNGESGLGGGHPDGKSDNWDWDSDCKCASKTSCLGTQAPTGVCPNLGQKLDCDEKSAGNGQGVGDFAGCNPGGQCDQYDNDCDGFISCSSNANCVFGTCVNGFCSKVACQSSKQCVGGGSCVSGFCTTPAP